MLRRRPRKLVMMVGIPHTVIVGWLCIHGLCGMYIRGLLLHPISNLRRFAVPLLVPHARMRRWVVGGLGWGYVAPAHKWRRLTHPRTAFNRPIWAVVKRVKHGFLFCFNHFFIQENGITRGPLHKTFTGEKTQVKSKNEFTIDFTIGRKLWLK